MTGLIRRIEKIAEQERASRVTRVRVWCGALSHMSAAHCAEHFREAARGTIAEGAALDVTVSDDITDRRAQDVMLESVDIES